jgi:chromatin assembly factor 1 subunit A
MPIFKVTCNKANKGADSLEHHHSIDPFSTQYWQPKVAPAPVAAEPAVSGTQLKLTASGKTAGMAPPPAPGSGAAAAGGKGAKTSSPALTLQQQSSSQQAQGAPDWATLMPKTLLKDFKKAVVSPDVNFLTKAGIVDMLSQRFGSVTKNQVRATLDFVAERCAFPGEKKSAKRWVLRPEHALNKD